MRCRRRMIRGGVSVIVIVNRLSSPKLGEVSLATEGCVSFRFRYRYHNVILVFLSFRTYPVGIDDADECFYCELASKEKHTGAASKTRSWPERKGFYGFCYNFCKHARGWTCDNCYIIA